MINESYNKSFDTENYTIVDSYAKAIRRINEGNVVLCSISGGSVNHLIP